MFSWNSLAFSMIQQLLAIWSLVPLPFLKPAWTSGRSWFTYCWSLAWRIKNFNKILRILRRGIRGNKLEDETQVIWSFRGFSLISVSILVWNIISFSLKIHSWKSMNLKFKSGVLQNTKWLLSNLVLLLMTTQIL